MAANGVGVGYAQTVVISVVFVYNKRRKEENKGQPTGAGGEALTDRKIRGGSL